MAADFGVSAFDLCGAEADGAISWVCPGDYLEKEDLLILRRSAGKTQAYDAFGGPRTGLRPRHSRRSLRRYKTSICRVRPRAFQPKYVGRCWFSLEHGQDLW